MLRYRTIRSTAPPPGGRRASFLVVLAGALVIGGMLAPSRGTHGLARAATALPTFSHVMVIMLENKSYNDVVGNGNAPYINTTLLPSTASATNFYAQVHNSLTAYLAVSSGRNYVSSNDGGGWASGGCNPSLACSTADLSLYEQLTGRGRTWKVYAESQPSACQTTDSGSYFVWHNPAPYYRNLGPNSYISTGNGTCQRDDVAYSQLASDIAAGTVPDFAFLTPNLCDDMHSGCSPLYNQVKQGDTWLNTQLSGNATVAGGLLNWARTHDTLLLITFDEGNSTDTQTCCPYASTGGGGRILTVVIGPTAKVKAGGYRGTVGYNLFSILKTAEENWGLALLHHAADSTVQDLSDFYLSTSSSNPTATPTATRAPTATSTPPPSGSTFYRKEAEAMTLVGSGAHVTYDPTASGSNAVKAWTNSSGVGGSATFNTSGTYAFTFGGREDYYGGTTGAHAHVAVYLDGATSPAAGAYVTNTSGYLPYTIRVSLSAGTHSFRVLFDNDAYGGSSSTDRNAYLDYVAIAAA